MSVTPEEVQRQRAAAARLPGAVAELVLLELKLARHDDIANDYPGRMDAVTRYGLLTHTDAGKRAVAATVADRPLDDHGGATRDDFARLCLGIGERKAEVEAALPLVLAAAARHGVSGGPLGWIRIERAEVGPWHLVDVEELASEPEQHGRIRDLCRDLEGLLAVEAAGLKQPGPDEPAAEAATGDEADAAAGRAGGERAAAAGDDGQAAPEAEEERQGPMPGMLDVTAVAARLGVGETTVRTRCRDRKKPCHNAEQHAGRWCIPEQDVPE